MALTLGSMSVLLQGRRFSTFTYISSQGTLAIILNLLAASDTSFLGRGIMLKDKKVSLGPTPPERIPQFYFGP